MAWRSDQHREPSIEITRSDDFPLDGPPLPIPYVRVEGFAHFTVDPEDPHNEQIVDLVWAPRDAAGKVVVSSRFLLLRPRDDHDFSGTLVYEINNRGNIVIANQANDTDPSNRLESVHDIGNGYLFAKGWAWLWSSWSWDIAPGVEALSIQAPPAVADEPIVGPVAYEFIVDAATDTASFVGLNAHGYDLADAAAESATLSWQDAVGARTIVSRELWRFLTHDDGSSAGQVQLIGGFRPGVNYELHFMAKDPVVAGIGFVLVRDLLHHVNKAGLAGLRAPQATIIEGISQSGRFIHDMLYRTLHVRDGVSVFDAAMIIVSGSGKGGFNARFVQNTRAQSGLEENRYPSDYFPFSPAKSDDAISGREGGSFDRLLALNAVPKVFFVNTSAEYWSRGVSLLHTDPSGTEDLALPDNVRLYHIAGGQHYPLRDATWQAVTNPPNPFDHLQAVRALFPRLEAWARRNIDPPASRHPHIANGTLISVDEYRARLVDLPGVVVASRNMRPRHLDFGPRFESEGIADQCPPVEGAAYTTLVPSPDADGIDLGGVRMPEIEAPLGTYLGWNLRHPNAGRPDMCGRFDGTFIPFALDAKARLATNDPRPSIAERYGSRSGYLERLRTAIDCLIEQGFLLDEEREHILRRGGVLYDMIHSDTPPAEFPRRLKSEADHRSYIPDYDVAPA